MALTYKYFIHEEYKSRLNLENVSEISALIRLVMQPGQQQAGASCFCSGTCIEHQFFWY
jgi:hypothetical protein